MDIGQKVMVTTQFRGVFFGALLEDHGETVVLGNARNCVRWSTEMHGFLGLASRGPGEGCRIGPAVERLELRGVTSVTACTDEAIERWEKSPWS